MGGAGLGGLLQGSGEDTLHLVLESLATVIKQDQEKGAAWEAHISPCVIQLWAHHVADPLLAMEAGAVIEALAAGPAFPHLLVCVPPMHMHPYISRTIHTALAVNMFSLPTANKCNTQAVDK